MLTTVYGAIVAYFKQSKRPDLLSDEEKPVDEVSKVPVILSKDSTHDAYFGWHQPGVAVWQNAAYRALLDQMYKGDVRLDLKVAADAVAATGLSNPTLLEVGCGSGYYNEVFKHLSGHPFAYTGLDYSSAMIELAIAQYPETPFVQGDATAMEFDDNSFDIVMNGAALMHMPAYEAAIAENRRVSKSWCIFHTIPVVQQRATTVLKKTAYGEEVVEITFNNRDLEEIFRRNGLVIRKRYNSISHDYLNGVLGEQVSAYTFLCQKVRT